MLREYHGACCDWLIILCCWFIDYKLQIQLQIETSCVSQVKFAALDKVFVSNCANISWDILFSIAAPIKNVCGLSLFSANANLILSNAVFAVFQCSSAPAGSIPPFNSPSAIYYLAFYE